MIPVQVLRKTHEATDIVSLVLARADGAPLPAVRAGAHVDVQVPGGATRQYSLCGDPGATGHYRIAVLRDPASRGGSIALHAAVREGDSLLIGEPRNLFALVPARRSLLFAGGIGVTPLLAMARELAIEGADFTLHYCTRSLERTAFRDELLASEHAHRVRFHHDDGAVEQRLDAAAALGEPRPDTHVYVCGPSGFIDWITVTAARIGWPANQVHVEHFSSAAGAAGAFQVKLASSGAIIDVPADQSVVAALRDHGIDIPVSCEQGVCGTCVTRVLEGECDHRDQYLTEDEKAAHDQFTPCCSRARGSLLVLDV